MQESLPQELIDADEALHALFQRVAFSRYLNPLNAQEAREAFAEGKTEPPFRYLRADWADDALEMLGGLTPPKSHPFGPMMADSIHGIELMTRALRDRTPLAFEALSEFGEWRPDEALLEDARKQVRETDSAPFSKTAEDLVQDLDGALRERGMSEWRVELDPVMSARVLVDSAKMVLRVNSSARFRDRDTIKLIAHEIDVHARRAVNGKRQALRLFATGLPGSLETEEGLALYAEECANAASPGNSWRQGLVVQAVSWAEELGFRELYDKIAQRGGPGLAWGISLRVKRGLSNPGGRGVYAKDVVYFRGLRTVRDWLSEGGRLEQLYVGKVAVHHPVQEWLDAGLIQSGGVPVLFEGHACAS